MTRLQEKQVHDAVVSFYRSTDNPPADEIEVDRSSIVAYRAKNTYSARVTTRVRLNEKFKEHTVHIRFRVIPLLNAVIRDSVNYILA